MPLNQNQQNQLVNAIIGYAFPTVYYDFINGEQVDAPNMKTLEGHIAGLLRSKNITYVKHGLANVLYWGYAQVGYRNVRVNRFFEGATQDKIKPFMKLVFNGMIPNMAAIKTLRLPEFSGMSFISNKLLCIRQSVDQTAQP